MLIVKVFVNERQIDEIKIHNVSPGHNGDFHDYKIRKPEIDNLIIKHQRSKGWMPLVHTVLGYLIKKEK
jgi:hypothetical protein